MRFSKTIGTLFAIYPKKK